MHLEYISHTPPTHLTRATHTSHTIHTRIMYLTHLTHLTHTSHTPYTYLTHTHTHTPHTQIHRAMMISSLLLGVFGFICIFVAHKEEMFDGHYGLVNLNNVSKKSMNLSSN